MLAPAVVYDNPLRGRARIDRRRSIEAHESLAATLSPVPSRYPLDQDAFNVDPRRVGPRSVCDHDFDREAVGLGIARYVIDGSGEAVDLNLRRRRFGRTEEREDELSKDRC